MGRYWVALGAVAGAMGVALSAVVAHGFAGLPPPDREAVRTALDTQLVHALALMAAGLWLRQDAPVRGRRLGQAAAGAFAAGLFLFCGGIYGHHLLGWPTGAAAPVGGTLLIAAWLLLAASALAAASPPPRAGPRR